MKRNLFITLILLTIFSLPANSVRWALTNLPYARYSSFHDGMAVFQDRTTDKYGAIDTNGKIVIPATYKKMSDFIGGASMVETESGVGFINKRGMFLLQPDPQVRIYEVYDRSVQRKRIPGLYRITTKDQQEGFWYKNKIIIPVAVPKDYVIDFPFITWRDSVGEETKILSLETGDISCGKIEKKGHLHVLSTSNSKGKVYRLFSKEGEELKNIELSSQGVRMTTNSGICYNLISQTGDTILSESEQWIISVPTWQHDMICAWKMVWDSQTRKTEQFIRLYDGYGKIRFEKSSLEELFSGSIEGCGLVTYEADTNFTFHYELYNFKGERIAKSDHSIELIYDNWFFIRGEKNYIVNASTKRKYACKTFELSDDMLVCQDYNGHFFTINLKNNNYLAVSISSITKMHAYHEGVAIVETEQGKYGKSYAIDKYGNILLQDCDDYSLWYNSESSEGVILVSCFGSNAYVYNPVKLNTPIYGKSEYYMWLYEEGVTLYKNGNYTKAKEHFYDVMINDPQNVNSINYYGCCLERLGYYDGAIDAFRTILTIDPDNQLAKDNIEICKKNKIVAEQQEEYHYDQSMSWLDGLTQFFNVLGETAAQYAEYTNEMNSYREAGYNSYNSNSGKSSSSRNSYSQSGNENMSKTRDSRTYSDLESQLIKMNTYSNLYNDSQRQSIQSQMRSIRKKWEGRGYRMYHSSWEDWNGGKR